MNVQSSSVETTSVDSLSMPASSDTTAAAPDATQPNTPAKKVGAKKATASKAPSATRPAVTKKAVPAKKAAAAKKVSKPPAQAAAGSPKSDTGGKPAKKAPKGRPQLVRDSFTMPEADFDLIAALKAKALDARRAAKKSELLRAGLRLLSGLEAKALVAALDKLEPVKIGRPKKGR
jgi:hypothetical protein